MFDTYNFHFYMTDTKLVGELTKISTFLHTMKEDIMATQSELALALEAAVEKITKIEGETQSLIDKVVALTEAVANAGNTTPEVDAALAAVQAKLEALDAKVDDVVQPTPVE